MHWEVFRVVGVLLILLKIEFGEKLASFHNRVVAVLQNAIRIIYLQTFRQRHQKVVGELARPLKKIITMWIYSHAEIMEHK